MKALTTAQANLLTEAVVWGRLTLRADQLFRQGSKEPVGDMRTLAPLVRKGLFKTVTRTAVEITIEGRKAEREAHARSLS